MAQNAGKGEISSPAASDFPIQLKIGWSIWGLDLLAWWAWLAASGLGSLSQTFIGSTQCSKWNCTVFNARVRFPQLSFQVLRDKIGSAMRPKGSRFLLHTRIHLVSHLVSHWCHRLQRGKGQMWHQEIRVCNNLTHRCVTCSTRPSWFVTPSVTPRSLEYAIKRDCFLASWHPPASN